MRQLLTLIALVAGILIPTAGAFGTPSAADPSDHSGIGIRLLDAPVATRDNPRARVYIIDHVAPGTRIERSIEVSNNTGETAQIAVYPAAATIKGGSFVGLEGDTPNELSTWTALSSPRLDLADGATKKVEVTIVVPSDAAPGEQYGVIWAQTTSAAKAGGGVTQVSRVGIRVYLSVGPGGEPASDFKVESLTAARDTSGNPLVQALIHNTGGRALDLGGTLRLSEGPGGLSAGPFPVSLGTTLGIGQTEPVTIRLNEQLPNGPWKARIEVTSGLLTRTAQASIAFPESGTGETVTVSNTTSRWWWVGGAALALGLLTLVWRLWTRRRREEAPEPALARAAPGARSRPDSRASEALHRR